MFYFLLKYKPYLNSSLLPVAFSRNLGTGVGCGGASCAARLWRGGWAHSGTAWAGARVSGGPDDGRGGAAMCETVQEATSWLVTPAPPRRYYWTAHSAAATHSKSLGA